MSLAIRMNVAEDGTATVTVAQYDASGARTAYLDTKHDSPADALGTVADALGLVTPAARPTEPAPEEPPPAKRRSRR